ncbi:GntR family transcriptional regulator [Jatrophihabitans sp. DSM 45814]
MTTQGERRPAYETLARELRAKILQGQFADGKPLPTETSLAIAHGVSRQTARRAFQDLVAEGMVYRVRGRGTFATAPGGKYLRQFGSVDDLMGLSQDTSFELLDPPRRGVNVQAAGRLRLESDVVLSLTFRRLHDDLPFCVTTVFVPPEIGLKLTDVPELSASAARSHVTIIGLLDARLERPIAEADQSVSVATATEEIAQALDCGVGIPLLRIDRMYVDTAGHPVELATSHFVPSRYTYRVRLRRNTP